MRILIIAPFIPYPVISGDAVRLYNLLLHIQKKHQVWLACLLDEGPHALDGVPHLRELCAGVIVAFRERRSRLKRIPGLMQYAFAGKPPELKFYESAELIQQLQQLSSDIDFDIIQIEHSCMGLYSELFPESQERKRILVVHNVTSQQKERIARIDRARTQSLRSLLYGWTMHRWEPRYAERFDRCVTVSEPNRELLCRVNPRLQVDVIPNGVDTQLHRPLPLESTTPALVFVGMMNYPPNSDGALYFCREILPIVKRSIPSVELWIVGQEPGPEVLELGSDTVHVTGRVEDVTPYYQRGAVAVVPLRAGGGTRLKILEAMAIGRPVVTTSIGCEGLDVRDGEHLFIADTPEEFAARTIQLLDDSQLHQRIAANARELVVRQYDWGVIAGQMLNLYAEMEGSGHDRP